MRRKHYWIIPLIILAVLLFANHYRWDETVKSNGLAVIKWKTDTWAGQKWIQVMAYDRFEEKPTPNTITLEEAKYRENILTKRWMFISGLVLFWLLISIWITFVNNRGERNG